MFLESIWWFPAYSVFPRGDDITRTHTHMHTRAPECTEHPVFPSVFCQRACFLCCVTSMQQCTSSRRGHVIWVGPLPGKSLSSLWCETSESVRHAGVFRRRSAWKRRKNIVIPHNRKKKAKYVDHMRAAGQRVIRSVADRFTSWRPTIKTLWDNTLDFSPCDLVLMKLDYWQ